MKRELKPKERECRKCGKVKPLSQFNRLIRGAHGVRAQCKQCESDYRSARGLNVPQEPSRYEINADTIKNHMYIHFGWWESVNTSIERDQRNRDVRKYYKEEQQTNNK